MSERFLTANMRASVISEMNLMEIYTEMEHGINIWLQKEGTSHVEGLPKEGITVPIHREICPVAKAQTSVKTTLNLWIRHCE